MKITVEGCWNGGNKYRWRLLPPPNSGHDRLQINAGNDPTWTRADATNCLDSIEYNWGVNRRNIRFEQI